MALQRSSVLLRAAAVSAASIWHACSAVPTGGRVAQTLVRPDGALTVEPLGGKALIRRTEPPGPSAAAASLATESRTVAVDARGQSVPAGGSAPAVGGGRPRPARSPQRAVPAVPESGAPGVAEELAAPAPAAVAPAAARLAEGRTGIPEGFEDASLVLDEALQVRVSVETLESGGLLIGTRAEPAAPAQGGTEPGAPAETSLLVQLMVPMLALALGGGTYVLQPDLKIPAQLLLFFGAQTFMNLYMKAVLSNSTVSKELHMRGFQAPLVLTALQQLVGFCLLALGILASQLTPWAYKPQAIVSKDQALAVMALAVCFTLNIALNNFSLSLLDMSVNVMIRSLSPLTSLLLQLCFRHWFSDGVDTRPAKIGIMLLGVIFAMLVVVTKYADKKSKGHDDNSTDTLGLALCFFSLIFSSMELIAVVILGNGFHLNSIDSLLYMAIPVVVLLLLPIYIIKHPVAYPGHNAATDYSVAVEVAHLSPGTVVLVMMSGIWALAYNLLLYNIVKGLSPYFASFAANFNKVAAIGLALLLGLESLPQGYLKYLMCAGVIGNMLSFTAFSAWPKQASEESGQQQVQSL